MHHPDRLLRFAASVLVGLSIATAEADGQEARPKAPRDPLIVSAPHEKMSFFEGTWSMEPGAWFKGGGTGPSQHEETCGWLPGGRRHMVCGSWSLRGADTVRRESIYILSYQDHDSTYLAHFGFSAGATLTYIGRVEGDRWIMDMQPSPLLPPNRRFRTIITKVGTGLRFVEEHSVDGGPWSVTEDYRYRRVR
jgi:hypothetical protein